MSTLVRLSAHPITLDLQRHENDRYALVVEFKQYERPYYRRVFPNLHIPERELETLRTVVEETTDYTWEFFERLVKFCFDSFMKSW